MHSFLLCLLLLAFPVDSYVSSIRSFIHPRRYRSALNSEQIENSPVSDISLKGKIVVSGIGQVEEDEFMLNLLNEQSSWSSVVLATTEDSNIIRKRFLSRTARYSGLLNILEFQTVDMEAEDQLLDVLSGANAWLAFNVSQSSIPRMTKNSLSAGVKRLVVTMGLPPSRVNDTLIPEFDNAIAAFKAAGASFTGIRHGEIIEGDENNPYEIYNSTIRCLEPTVERGVLARVAAELLMIPTAANSQCGVSSSSAFAQAYLNILRSSGLTRRQEVTKLFQGGLQRVAQLTLTSYKAGAKRQEERAAAAAERKAQEELEATQAVNTAAAKSLMALPGANTMIKKRTQLDDDENAAGVANWDDEAEPVVETDEEKVNKRSEEILTSVWREFQTRMHAKSTSKGEFFDTNRPMAIELAQKELDEAKTTKEDDEVRIPIFSFFLLSFFITTSVHFNLGPFSCRLTLTSSHRSCNVHQPQKEAAAKQLMLDRLVDVNRKQYVKLLTLERKEMQNQKVISDIWVKYIYMLLEVTMKSCKDSGALFHNLDQFAQTVLLRETANKLRQLCSLPPNDIIYDPLDAAVIVASAEKMDFGKDVHMPADIDQVLAEMTSKYGPVLKDVPALRGAAQIIQVAVETLNKELPPAPLSVTQMRGKESSEKREAISAGRLDAIKKRGKPTSEGTSVGRM